MVEKIHKGFQSRNDLNYLLTELKQAEPWLYKHHSKMLQMVSTQLGGAQKALIELNKKGHNAGSYACRDLKGIDEAGRGYWTCPVEVHS